MKTNIHFFISLSVFLRMRNVSGKVVVKIKTDILCSVSPPPPKPGRLERKLENSEKTRMAT